MSPFFPSKVPLELAMAQWVKVLDAKPSYLSLVPGLHMVEVED